MKYQAIDSDYIREMKEYDEFMRDKKLLYKGMKYGYFVAIFIIILSAFFSGNLVLAQSSNTDYDFENAYAYNGVLPETPEMINLRNTTESDGIYPATYTFTEEELETSGVDIAFITSDSTSGNCLLSISDFDGHNRVLNSTDNDNTARVNFMADLSTPISYGTYEYWFQSTDVNKDFDVRAYDFTTGTIGVVLGINAGYLKYYASASWNSITTLSSNVWYHISVDFECGAGSYVGLASDTFKVRIDGISYGAYPFYQNINNFEKIYCYGNIAHTGYSMYIDGLGITRGTLNYTEKHFDTSPEAPNLISITNDGNNLFGLDNNFDYVVEYTTSGSEVDTYDISSESNNPAGLTYDGTYFWLSDSVSRLVFQYYSNFTYTGFSFDINPTVYSAYGITNNGEYLYIYCRSKDEITQWTFEGIYNGLTVDVSTESAYYSDISFHNNIFMCLDDVNSRIYFYDSNLTYTESSVGIIEGYPDPASLTGINDRIFVFDGALDEIYEYYDYIYFINGNKYSTYLTTNITETDKFEFTFNSTGDMNADGDDDVNGFTDIENDYWSNDVVNIYPSIDGYADKCIRVLGGQLGNVGIERDFDTDDVIISEVWWQLDLINMGYPENEIYTKIENDASEIIAFFKLNGSYAPYYPATYYADLCYYYDSEWIILKSNIKPNNNYNMTFCLNWTNGDDKGVLGFNGSIYEIPFDKDQNSIGLFQIYGINDHNVVFGNIDLQIDWIRIIVNGNSVSDELMPDNLYILSGSPFSLLTQSFIEITFNISIENNVSIVLNNEIQILDYGLNITADRVFFGNFFQDKSYSNLYLTIYNSSEYQIEGIKIWGIQLTNQQDPTDTPFLEFDYSEVDINESYFYVIGNDLYYNLETNDNGNIEYIQATFDITDFACKNYAIAFTHVKSFTYLTSECKIVFTTDTYLSFISTETTQAESLILPQDKTIKEIVFLITDDDTAIVDTSTGYFTEITLIYYPDIGTTITTLSLIEVIPLLIILTLIPIVIYYGFGKRKELIVPSLMLVSIFGTAIDMIPIWLEVVILFSCVAYYILRYNRGG